MRVIDVERLQKRYRDRQAVRDISFTVEQGEIFGMVGPNGAGKTTTVECIAGLRRPDAGRVRVLGRDPQADGRELRERVGVQLQAGQLPDRLRVWEALQLYSTFYQNPADWRQLIELLGLSGNRDTAYGQLSGGQKQRLTIALALVGNPEILILDEVTAGLDPQARRDIWHLIEDARARGVTVLLVTHFMEEAERLCDRVAVMDAGRLVALDTPAGLVSLSGAEQRLHFRPLAPLDERLLAGLPGVTSVTRAGATLAVTGTGDLVQAVTALLARHQVAAAELRLQPATLDDAFLALTGHRMDNAPNGDLR